METREAVAVAQRRRAINRSADKVSLDRIPGGIGQQNSPFAVGGDQIARPRQSAANGVGRRVFEIKAQTRIAQRGCAADISPDNIALKLISSCAAANQKDPVIVAANQVASARTCPADEICRRVREINAPERVSERHGAGDIGADGIALKLVSRGAGANQVYPGASIPGDDVAGTGSCAADDIRRRVREADARLAVWQAAAATSPSADKIALDHVASCIKANQSNAVPGVP